MIDQKEGDWTKTFLQSAKGIQFLLLSFIRHRLALRTVGIGFGDGRGGRGVRGWHRFVMVDRVLCKSSLKIFPNIVHDGFAILGRDFLKFLKHGFPTCERLQH